MYLREGFHIFNFYKAVKDRNHDKKCIYSDYILLNESKCSLLLVCNPIFIEGPATQRAWLHNMLKIHPVPCWYIFTCIYKDIWGNISCDFMFILIWFKSLFLIHIQHASPWLFLNWLLSNFFRSCLAVLELAHLAAWWAWFTSESQAELELA